MGRPREFDEGEALAAAMNVFWLKGYVATSMADLMEAMHLHKGSIYKAFGDKHQLFMAALTHYLQSGAAEMKRAFETAESPREAVLAFLTTSVGECVSGPVIRGCLAMNSVVELGPHDESVRRVIDATMSAVRAELVRWITLGQQSGDFRTDQSAEDLAGFLLYMKAGILTGSKMNLDSQDPFGAAEIALAAIG